MTNLLMRLWPSRLLPSDTDTGGAVALANARAELVRTRRATAYYESLGSELRDIRERNHFADSIRATVNRSPS